MIHHKGSIRFHILVMARRFAFSDQDVLLHAFRFSSFSIDIPGGRLAPERLRRSGIARPIVDLKKENAKSFLAARRGARMFDKKIAKS